MKVLFVCTGNTCRSPMAQVIFTNLCKKHKRKGVKVASAGIFTRNGIPQMGTGVEALIATGEKLGKTTIKSTQFLPAMIKKYDFIVTMSAEHAMYIRGMQLGWSESEIKSVAQIGSLHEFVGCGDISDPFGGNKDVYITCCEQLKEALELLYKKILNGDR